MIVTILNDRHVAIIGGGPAGLMAAELIAGAGIAVSVFERTPRMGRKILMTGRGGGLDGPISGALFEGILWVARTGSHWRPLPDEYSKWNSVFCRFRRWVITGVFDVILEKRTDLASRDRRADRVDSTVIRAHHCAVGIKRGLKIRKRLAALAVASRPKSTSAATPGCPFGFALTPGQAHDTQGFMTLLQMIDDRIQARGGDKGYDSDAIRVELHKAGIEPVIPAGRNRRQSVDLDRETAKEHNSIERMFNKLKNWRRVAT